MSCSPRRPRFTLRTLFGLLTVAAIVCGWAVYQLNWIDERRRALDCLANSRDSWYAPSLSGAPSEVDAPWSLRLFGERGVLAIGIDRLEHASGRVPFELAELRRLFPETQVGWSQEGVLDAVQSPTNLPRADRPPQAAP